MLHYHLCILLLIDVVKTSDRFDLLNDMQKISAEAEGEVMNLLEFGLNNTFTFSNVANYTVNSPNGDTEASHIETSIISIDPYPHHVVASVYLLKKAIGRDLADGKICQGAFLNVQRILQRSLEELPKHSKSVQGAKQAFTQLASGNTTLDQQDPYTIFHAQDAG